MENSDKVFIARYDFETDADGQRKCKWLLTTNEEEASSIDQDYKLASVDDLHDWVCATSKVFNRIIQTENGKCKWVEGTYLDKYNEENYFCEYQLLLGYPEVDNV